MDYVIGGMDRTFKSKLFYILYAAEQAGFSPGITSGFRDDFRQSIASGRKARACQSAFKFGPGGQYCRPNNRQAEGSERDSAQGPYLKSCRITLIRSEYGPGLRRRVPHATIRGRRFDSMLSTSSAGRGGLNR
jgi:hypothetical protein